MNRKNLTVAYKDKDRVKALGARWDPIERTWYIDRSSKKSIELTKEERDVFGKWITTTDTSTIVQFTPTKWCPAYNP